MSLFARFFLVLLSLALAPVLASGIWFLRSSARVQDNARRLHEQLARLAADSVEESVGRLNRALAFSVDLERVPASRPDARDHALAVLQRASVTYPNFSLLAVLDPAGREQVRIADAALFPERDYADRAKEPLVAGALASGRAGVGPVVAAGETPLLTVVHPLVDGRSVYAVWNLSDLWKRIGALRPGSSGRLLLLDGAGAPLPALAPDFPRPRWDAKPPAGAPGWLDAIRTGGETMVGAHAPTPSLGWTALSLQPRAEAFAVGERFAAGAVAYLAALAGIVLAAAYWLAGRLTAPLTAMVEAAKRATRHDFSRPVPELGWGELSLLSRSFNEMMGELKSFRDLHVEQILEEKAKVDALIHTIPDGIVLASFDGKILYMNASARGLLSATTLETNPGVRTNVHEVFRQPALRDMLFSLMRKKARSANAELDIAHAGGGRGVYFCRAVTVMIAQRPVGILVVLRDVTHERELDKMKEEFFHSIVHDLRGPLGTIDGFVQVMEARGNLDAKQTMYIGFVRGSCERLRQLVTDILDTAKIESGQLTLKPAPFDLPGVFERMKALYALQAETKGIRFEVKPGAAPPKPFSCDKELTERVVMNLIGNALKFTPQGGVITLAAGAAEGGREVEFSIADTGPGIPADKLEAVFEKFKQLDAGIQARSGYGLGLSICKKVVELHGGRIWAESQLGRGSRFVFRLPLK